MGCFPGDSDCKNLPTMQKTLVQSLDWGDPLEKGIGTHSSIYACRIPWTEEPGRKESDTTEPLTLFSFLSPFTL